MTRSIAEVEVHSIFQRAGKSDTDHYRRKIAYDIVRRAGKNDTLKKGV